MLELGLGWRLAASLASSAYSAAQRMSHCLLHFCLPPFPSPSSPLLRNCRPSPPPARLPAGRIGEHPQQPTNLMPCITEAVLGRRELLQVLPALLTLLLLGAVLSQHGAALYRIGE